MLKPFGDELWIHEDWIHFYGVRLRTRMTVVRLSGDRLLLHSPTLPTPALLAALERLGEIAFLVSPNKIHHQGMGPWAEARPGALLYASPGLTERRPDLRFHAVLGDAPEPQWCEELDQAATGGNVFFSEVLFFHRPSRTLLVADLVENLDSHTTSRAGQLLAPLFGVKRRPMPSPEFRFYTLDPDSAAASLERPRRWEFDRIALAHGALVERDASAVFDRVCDELIATAERRSRLTGAAFRWMARHQ